jgi:hypothetical protein
MLMKPDIINALGLLSLIVLTLVAVAFLRVGRVDFRLQWKRRLFAGSVAAVGFLMITPAFLFHRCMSGQPVFHVFVTAACISVLLVFVSSLRIRASLCIIVLIVGCSLSNHYSKLVHTDMYLGTTELSGTKWRDSLPRPRVTRLWHTCFTGLYSLHYSQTNTTQQSNSGDSHRAAPDS